MLMNFCSEMIDRIFLVAYLYHLLLYPDKTWDLLKWHLILVMYFYFLDIFTLTQLNELSCGPRPDIKTFIRAMIGDIYLTQVTYVTKAGCARHNLQVGLVIFNGQSALI